MKKRLIINDFKANKLVTVSTCIFMAASAMLLGLSILLFGSLSSSIDSLMIKAQTPDFLQMHTGEIDEGQIASFSENRSDVEAMQICRFLNLQNSQLTIGGKSLIDNTQDNGLCCQSPLFDFLIDAENRRIQPDPGEVYVPVCYRTEYGLKTGDIMRINTEKLSVAGFLRDSQMNSMMASSKRFLVNESDYEKMKILGSEEYLIEFKLKKGSDTNAFSTAYEDAGLPGNGPTITYPLIKMMNALSDGMMILVILLVSTVVLFISILCIRYMILTQLEKDKREIGMLKAVGVSKKDIRGLYFSKYLLLSVIGCLVGVIAAVIAAEPLGTQMRELYGDAGNKSLIYLLMVLGSLAAEGIILLSVYRTLGKMEKMSAIQVLYGHGYFGKKKNLYLPIGIITAAALFMILVPWNIKSTIAAPEFVTYMGIGESQIRIDIRQTDDVEKTAKAAAKEIKRDDLVRDYTLMHTGSYKTVLPDGASYNLMIENGDHGRFPVRYIEGRYPDTADEIALSILNSKEMNVNVGDTIRVYKDLGDNHKSPVSCKVCGIYSDVTNGGKTAKACLDGFEDKTPVMWSVIYLSLKDENLADTWVENYREKYSALDDGIKTVKISDYIMGTYGQTIRNIKKAAIMSVISSCLILFVVMLLLLRLVIWRERSGSSLKKALGFTSAGIKGEYLKKTFKYILPGIVIGVFAGIVPGQSLAGILLGSMGAYGFCFIINPMAVFVAAPAVIAMAAALAIWASLEEVGRIHAYECLGARTGNY
ncbi:MAG: ABC transporter permease [Clostridiales bacterium]|nr:ABC transporter permease [Clostridiales bacterium]